MTKNDWIKLINAIRIRKKEYKGEDGEIKYRVEYKKSHNTRTDKPTSKLITMTYDECWLEVKNSSNSSFCLTYVYGHKITSIPKNDEVYSLDKIERFHAREVFIPHIASGHPTTHNGGLKGSILWGTDTNNFPYYCGLYAAAFFYALNVKNPVLRYKNEEWIIEDANLGQFDLISYFSHHQVIPISLPFPPMIEADKVNILKLADGVEVKDREEIKSEQEIDELNEDLEGIRK